MSTQDPFITSSSNNVSGSINTNADDKFSVIVSAVMWLLIVIIISTTVYFLKR